MWKGSRDEGYASMEFVDYSKIVRDVGDNPPISTPTSRAPARARVLLVHGHDHRERTPGIGVKHPPHLGERLVGIAPRLERDGEASDLLDPHGRGAAGTAGRAHRS